MFKYKIAYNAIHYILSHCGSKDKLTLIKLLFLADKYQLIRSGRTINSGSYVAMKAGPVSSPALDVLNCIEGTQSDFNKCNIDVSAISIEEGLFKVAEDIEYDELSEYDEEALDYVCDVFSDRGDLVKYTHKYPEWDQYKDYFKTHEGGSKPINIDDMFSIIDDSFGISQNKIDEIKAL